MDGTDGIKIKCERNHSRGSQQKLTARNREGKGLKWTKQTGEEAREQWRQTERRDLPLIPEGEETNGVCRENETESGTAGERKMKQIHHQKIASVVHFSKRSGHRQMSGWD